MSKQLFFMSAVSLHVAFAIASAGRGKKNLVSNGLDGSRLGHRDELWGRCGRVKSDFYSFWTDNREVLQNEFQYDFRKGPREISAGTVLTVFTCIMAFNTVITVPAKISRGPFRKSYRNSFYKTSLIILVFFTFCKTLLNERQTITVIRKWHF